MFTAFHTELNSPHVCRGTNTRPNKHPAECVVTKSGKGIREVTAPLLTSLAMFTSARFSNPI